MFSWLKKKKKEARIHPRWQIDRFIGVYDREQTTFLGRVQDLSLSGMCVAGSETPPVDRHVKLSLEILLDDGRTEIHPLRCRAQWVRPWGDSGFFLTGFEFSGIQPGVLNRIEQILREQNKIAS